MTKADEWLYMWRVVGAAYHREHGGSCCCYKCYWWKRVPGTDRYPRFW